MKVKVLCLDFDGVLNSHAFAAKKPGGLLGLDPDAVAIVNTIIERTGCDVVVSSTWRLGTRRTALCDTLKAVGFRGRVLGMTPDLSGRRVNGIWVDSRQRGHEIQAWLDEAPPRFDVQSFTILDDDSDMVHLAPRLVKTRFATGVTANDADRVVEMLGVKS